MTEDVKQEQEKQNQQAEDTVTAEEQPEEETEVTDASDESVDAVADTEQETDGDDETVTTGEDETETVSEEAPGESEEDDPEAATEEDVGVEPDEEDVATFTGEMEDDKVYTLDELQAASEDYTDDEFHSLASMYEDTLNEIEEKEIVKGRVVSVDEKYVVVDIGFKSEGIIQVNEFPDSVVENLAPGDEVEVFLDKVEDQEGQLILSRRKADILQAWETIERAHDTGEVLEGYIKRRIKGGMVVDIMGIDCFLPGSQIDVRPVRDFDAYVGKTMEFQVVKLNMQAENVVVSHRALIESDLE
ncbi:MAG: S1 RNA-binding domain-containing protein [Balneolaceae bacterium]|nr:S1 RNA-binding domain-containing protein [Balneolaceae bacterium]